MPNVTAISYLPLWGQIFKMKSFKHETAMNVIILQDVISGFHPLRWSGAIHQLVSIRFNLTHSLSLSSGLYICLHFHCLEIDTRGRSMLWWNWTIRRISADPRVSHPGQLMLASDAAPTTQSPQLNLNSIGSLYLCCAWNT